MIHHLPRWHSRHPHLTFQTSQHQSIPLRAPPHRPPLLQPLHQSLILLHHQPPPHHCRHRHHSPRKHLPHQLRGLTSSPLHNLPQLHSPIRAQPIQHRPLPLAAPTAAEAAANGVAATAVAAHVPNIITPLQPPLPKRRRHAAGVAVPPQPHILHLQVAAPAAAPMHPSLFGPINSLHLTTKSRTCSRRNFPTFQHYDGPTHLGSRLHHISTSFPTKNRLPDGSIFMLHNCQQKTNHNTYTSPNFSLTSAIPSTTWLPPTHPCEVE